MHRCEEKNFEKVLLKRVDDELINSIIQKNTEMLKSVKKSFLENSQKFFYDGYSVVETKTKYFTDYECVHHQEVYYLEYALDDFFKTILNINSNFNDDYYEEYKEQCLTTKCEIVRKLYMNDHIISFQKILEFDMFDEKYKQNCIEIRKELITK